MWDWMLLLTDLAQSEIAAKKSATERGELHPKAVKQELARAIVSFFHGEAAALAAESEFERLFAGGGGGVPDEVAALALSGTRPLAALLVDAALAPSKNEARRLVEQGAVTVDGERASDPTAILPARSEPYLLKVGKRKFLRLSLSD